MKIFIGCSGYSYDDWKGDFYPDDMPQNEWLSFYAEKLFVYFNNDKHGNAVKNAITLKKLLKA